MSSWKFSTSKVYRPHPWHQWAWWPLGQAHRPRARSLPHSLLPNLRSSASQSANTVSWFLRSHPACCTSFVLTHLPDFQQTHLHILGVVSMDDVLVSYKVYFEPWICREHKRSRSPGIPWLFHPFKDCWIRRCTALLWDLQIYCSMICDDDHHQGGMINIGS